LNTNARKGETSKVIDIVAGIRQALQDVVVPEFRALQEVVRLQGERLDRLDERFERLHQEMAEGFQRVDERFEHMSQEMNNRFERMNQEMAEGFQRADERFERMSQEMNNRFERMNQEMNHRFDTVHQEILTLTRSVASMDGKLDILVSQIVDYKAAVSLSARVEQLEKRVEELGRRS